MLRCLSMPVCRHVSLRTIMQLGNSNKRYIFQIELKSFIRINGRTIELLLVIVFKKKKKNFNF